MKSKIEKVEQAVLFFALSVQGFSTGLIIAAVLR